MNNRQRRVKPALNIFLRRVRMWEMEKRTFAKESRKVFQEMNITSGKLSREYGISRNIYWRIVNEDDYKPSYKTAIAICLAMKCGMTYTEYLLKLAGYALNDQEKEGQIYEKLIVNRCGCAETVNATLEEEGFPPLFK